MESVKAFMEQLPGSYVSVDTVKTHLKRIYRKLGASSRSEAVATARAASLVP